MGETATVGGPGQKGSPTKTRSTNDGRALSRRAQILTGYLAGYTPEDPLAGLDGIADGELPEREDADD